MYNLNVILNWDFTYEKQGHRKLIELDQGPQPVSQEVQTETQVWF